MLRGRICGLSFMAGKRWGLSVSFCGAMVPRRSPRMTGKDRDEGAVKGENDKGAVKGENDEARARMMRQG